MPDYHYLIIGGGMTADAAIKGIRQVDSNGSIGLISSEDHLPYDRPPLSKALWKGEAVDIIWRHTPTDDVEIHLSRTVKKIDPGKKIVTDDEGTVYSYHKLLLATGGRVRRLPYHVNGVIYFRTLDDYHKLKALSGSHKHIAVIGGGFIGSEIAAALTMNNTSVTMIFPEESLGARVYPAALSLFVHAYYQSKEVQIISGESVTLIKQRDTSYIVETSHGKELHVDGVVAGIGILPDTELAHSSNLAADNGVIVDEYLQTTQQDIYAAGDVANFYNPILNKRILLEHEDNANHMGETAGMNMAGQHVPYHYLPFFYSDLFDLGYEAIGEIDSRYEMIGDWKEPFREGVVYYLHQGRIKGILLWNTWGQVEAARQLLAEKGIFTAQTVKGRLPV
jgi:3-phenylpropionate/trans-cinnamate dioxygenase ferredoxin reductase subunit